MHQDIVKDIQETMMPVTMISDINTSAAGKLIDLQAKYMADLFNTSLAQVQALCSVQEPKEVFALQAKFFKELDAKLSSITEKEFTLLSETKEQLMGIIEQNISGMSDMYGMTEVTKLMQNTQESIEETLNIAAHKQDGASNKPAPTRKSS